MADKPRHLLSVYATETLTHDERRGLMAAALEDQDVFDRLVEEESWRRILNAPGVRRELLEALDEPGPLGKLWNALRLPALRPRTAGWVLGTVATVLLAVVLVPQWREPATSGTNELVSKSYSPELTAKSPTEDLATKTPGTDLRSLSYGLELGTAGGPRAVPEDHRFEPGDQFRIRLETDFPAWIYLFNRTSGDDAYSVVYPESAAEHVARTGKLVLPPGPAWWHMDETPDDERLVLVVASEPWAVYAPDRTEVPPEELETALGEAEAELREVSWRRFVEGDEVHLKIADRRDALVFVARLFAE